MTRQEFVSFNYKNGYGIGHNIPIELKTFLVGNVFRRNELLYGICYVSKNK